MKICEAFKVTTSRPLDALDKVGIAELVQFTYFDPKEAPTVAASADRAIRKEWVWEVEDSELNFLDFKGLRIKFKDGSGIDLNAR
jgi:hypothetical protein